MEFIVTSTQLLGHLLTASKIITTKSSLAILDNFKFEIKEGNLTITSSDLESTITVSMPLLSNDGEGTFAVNARELTDLIKEFPEQPLTFNVNFETYNITIVSSNGKYERPFLDGMDFPQTPTLKEDIVRTIEISSGAVLAGISSTFFAAANDEIRPIMNGIRIEFLPEEGVAFIATDAHKLSKYCNSEIQVEEECGFVLPKKPANILKSIISKSDDKIKLEFDDKNVVFTSKGFTYISRFIEGTYPNYKSVIPINNPYKMIVDRLELLGAVKRVSLMANKGSQLIGLAILDNQLTISAKDFDYSTAGDETISCQYDSDKIIIGFKSSVILEILSNLNCNDVVFELSDPSRAGIIVPHEKENETEDYLMLAMPIMIREDE